MTEPTPRPLIVRVIEYAQLNRINVRHLIQAQVEQAVKGAVKALRICSGK